MQTGASSPKKDRQTVTSDGHTVEEFIAGVIIRPARLIEDDRGDLCEIFNPAWGISAPLVTIVQVTIRPKKVKGWAVHRKQDDRYFISYGVFRLGLYDDRADSPTHKRLMVFTISDRNRALIVIPHGVYHAIQNLGTVDAMFLEMPTVPYNYEDPDKYRLPLKNDLIPYAFEDTPGW